MTAAGFHGVLSGGGVGLACGSCSAAQGSRGSDPKEELKFCFCSKDLLKIHNYFLGFVLKIGIASCSLKASCNK